MLFENCIMELPQCGSGLSRLKAALKGSCRHVEGRSVIGPTPGRRPPASHAIFRIIGVALIGTACVSVAHAQLPEIHTASYRVEFREKASGIEELLSVRQGANWIETLSGAPALLVQTATGASPCRVQQVFAIASGVLVEGKCQAGSFEQRLLTSADADRLEVSTRFTAARGVDVRSVEDR